MRILTGLFFILFSFSLTAQDINIIPRPAEYLNGQGRFSLNSSVVLVVKNGVDDNTADLFNAYLRSFYGFQLRKVKDAASNYIRFTTLQMLVPGKEGAYSLVVNPKNITIQGQTASGTYYGMQTLIQLLPVEKNTRLIIGSMTINDAPRFPYRGMHLDVGRHFMPVDFIKKYIDYIALHKMNYFHWHLTEDQGWRIEIKKYPKLTQIGAWRNGTIIGRYPGKGNDNKRYGGYYTQEQIKDIVAYAQKRFITIVPEIEMPGHSSAAIAAYPELSCFPGESTKYPKQCAWNGDSTGKQVQQTWGVFEDVYCAGKENTFKFLEDVMDEVLGLFPSTYIHVGGDECPKENWKRCPLCQQRKKENNLKDEHELQSYFIQRIEKYLNSKGRTLIGWDEILEGGLAPKAMVMSWRGEQGGIDAAKQNHDVIMTPGGWCYLDHSQTEREDSVTIGGYTPIEKVYGYEPVPAGLNEEQSKHVLGAQGNVWTEYMDNTRKVEYMIFPRISALSEVLWTGKEKRDWNDFEKRLLLQFKRYDVWHVNYSKAYFDLKASVLPSPDNNVVLWKLESKIPGYYIKVTTPLKNSTKSITYSDPLKINKPGNYSANLINLPGNNRNVKMPALIQKFSFNKATGKKITLTNPPSKNYPGDGPFTLVNGVINEMGTRRSKEFLGFNGTDCEAIIDLGSSQLVSFVVVNAYEEQASWIYRPMTAEVFGSSDGKTFYSLKLTDDFVRTKNGKGTMTMPFKATYARYLKVLITNWGMIPAGQPGAGNKPWLFIDEIEVEGPGSSELLHQ